jgi:hypothetical protein
VEVRAVTCCPSCGVTTAAGPHARVEECIEALEKEIERLRGVLATRVKSPVGDQPPSTHGVKRSRD